MVGLLVLAADGHEAQLASELEQLIELDQLPDLHALTALLAPRPGVLPERDGRTARCWRATTRCWGCRHERGAIGNAGRLGLMLTELRLPTIKRLAARSVRAVRPRGLAGQPAAGGAARARDERARGAPHRAPPRRVGAEPGQAPVELRLRRRAQRVQGPGDGAGRRAPSGSTAAPTCCCSARPAWARAILVSGLGHALIDAGRRVLFMRCSRAGAAPAGGAARPAPGRTSWPSSIASICSSWTT